MEVLNGRLAKAAAVPPKILAVKRFKLGFSGWTKFKISLDYSKVANIPTFNAILLKTVGNAPLKKLFTPSSAKILHEALKSPV